MLFSLPQQPVCFHVWKVAITLLLMMYSRLITWLSILSGKTHLFILCLTSFRTLLTNFNLVIMKVLIIILLLGHLKNEELLLKVFIIWMNTVIDEKRLVYTKMSYVTYMDLCFPFIDFSSAFKLLLNENTIKLQYHKFPNNNVLLLPRCSQLSFAMDFVE